MNKTLYILAFGVFAVITTEFGVIGVLPLLSKAFGVSIDKAGWLLSGFALTVALSGLFVSMLTASVNRKIMLLFVLGTFVVSNILSACASSFTLLLLFRILPAFFYPVFWSTVITMAYRLSAPEQSAKAIAVIGSGLSIATVAGVPIATYFAALFDWKASFLVSAVINLSAFIALLLYVPTLPAGEKTPVGGQAGILKQPYVWVNYLYVLLLVAGMFSTYSYLAQYFTKITRMSAAQVSMMLFLFGAAGIAGNWATGKILSKSLHRTIRFYPVVLILIEMLVYFCGGFFAAMIAMIILWGFVHTGGFLVGNVRGALHVPPASLEFVNSLLPSVFNFGILFGTFLGGTIIEQFGTRQMIWVSVLLLLSAFALSHVRSARAVTEGDLACENDNLAAA